MLAKGLTLDPKVLAAGRPAARPGRPRRPRGPARRRAAARASPHRAPRARPALARPGRGPTAPRRNRGRGRRCGCRGLGGARARHARAGDGRRRGGDLSSRDGGARERRRETRPARAVTRRNLELVPIAAAARGANALRIRRRRIALALGVVAAVVLLGVGAAAVWADDPADGEAADTTPAESVADTTAETTEPADTEGPSVEVRVPAEAVRGSVEVAAAADDPSGVGSVAFTALGEGAPVELGEDTEAPFVATWDTTTVPDGAYRIVATASDAQATRASPPASLLVDNTAPTVTQGTPEPGEGSYRLSAEAEDAGSGVESVRFEFGRLESSDANVDEVEWGPGRGGDAERGLDLRGHVRPGRAGTRVLRVPGRRGRRGWQRGRRTSSGSRSRS